MFFTPCMSLNMVLCVMLLEQCFHDCKTAVDFDAGWGSREAAAETRKKIPFSYPIHN